MQAGSRLTPQHRIKVRDAHQDRTGGALAIVQLQAGSAAQDLVQAVSRSRQPSVGRDKGGAAIRQTQRMKKARSDQSYSGYPPTDGVYGVNDTISLGAVRRLVDKRGAMRAREVLEIIAGAGLSPITADHVRVAEALLLDPDYAGGLTSARITVALRDLTPKQAAEAKEVAFAKRMPVSRALAAVLYRAHATPKRTRAKVAEAA